MSGLGLRAEGLGFRVRGLGFREMLPYASKDLIVRALDSLRTQSKVPLKHRVIV